MKEQNVHARWEQEEFTLRAAALIIRRGHLLVVKNERLNCFYTVGGGVHPMEETAVAAQREVLEETGLSLRAEHLSFVQERFYAHDGRVHHELVFFYRMEGDASAISDGQQTDRCDERLCWLPIERLEEYPLLPPCLAVLMKEDAAEIRHIISRE